MHSLMRKKEEANGRSFLVCQKTDFQHDKRIVSESEELGQQNATYIQNEHHISESYHKPQRKKEKSYKVILGESHHVKKQ